MTEKKDTSDDEIVYAFSSLSRDLYTRDIYNTLALPPGFKIRFRYRKKWHNINKEDADSIEGKDAVIVAAPSTEYTSDAELAKVVQDSQTRYNFFPLRKASVDAVDLRGAMLYITFELQEELVKYGEDPTDPEKDPFNIASELDNFPRFGVESRDNDAFLTTGTPTSSELANNDEMFLDDTEWDSEKSGSEWQRIIRWLGTQDTFCGTLFYRIRSLKNAQNNKLVDPRELFGNFPANNASDDNTGYELKANRQYRLYLTLTFAGSVPENIGAERMQCKANSVSILPADFDLGFRTEEKYLTIDPDLTTSRYDTLLSITSTVDFNTPQVEFPLRVVPSWERKYAPQLIFFIGLFILLALSPVIVHVFSQIGLLTWIQDSTVRRLIDVVGTASMIAGMHFYARFRQVG